MRAAVATAGPDLGGAARGRSGEARAGGRADSLGDGLSTVTECWACESAVDCGVARMCLAHPTGAIRMAAVVRAVRTMRASLAGPLSLTSLAQAALLSPFHFHRVFRHVTATTPARYLVALRMAEAKRLLACTSISVSEVRTQCGYASLGTFTSQFNRLVGVSPRVFRELMADVGGRPVAELLATVGARLDQHAGRRDPDGDPGRTPGGNRGGGFEGAGNGFGDGTGDGTGDGPVGVLAGAPPGGPPDGAPALLGLFDSGVPQRRPVACAVATSPGAARLGPVPDGAYHALAVAFDPAATVREALADHRAPVRYVGTCPRPVVIADGRRAGTFHVMLRRPRLTDAPVVPALPLLVAAELAGTPAR